MTAVQECGMPQTFTKAGQTQGNQFKPKNGTAAHLAGQNSPPCTLSTKIKQTTSFTAFHPEHKDIAKLPHSYCTYIMISLNFLLKLYLPITHFIEVCQ